VSLRYRIVGLGDMHQAQDLLVAAYNESASSAKQYPLNVNWVQYQKFSDAGLLHICGCFDGATLVGFVLVIKSLELWGLGGFVADVTAIYLRPEYRKGLNGYRLIRQAEKLATAIDCREIRFSVSRRSKSHRGKARANLFATIGYQFREAVFTKRL
jgi:GNAT superfamily N-acetyltransferase